MPDGPGRVKLADPTVAVFQIRIGRQLRGSHEDLSAASVRTYVDRGMSRSGGEQALAVIIDWYLNMSTPFRYLHLLESLPDRSCAIRM